jgi:hypothetical protein
MSHAPLSDDDLMRRPHENEEIPAEDIAASADAVQPETQGVDPLDAELGARGQGDLLTEDEPVRDAGGPDDLRVTDEP